MITPKQFNNITERVVDDLLLQKDLLEQIIIDKNITRPQLCERLNVSLATIRRTIAQLKELGLLIREGSDKNGYWIVRSSKGGNNGK